jgi:hypothetical protein
MGFLDTGKAEGLDYFQQGMDTGQGYLDRAGAMFEPLAKLGQGLGAKYGAGTDMYLNAMGVNGPQGVQAAQNAFQTGPGYQFAMQQGNEALARKRSAGNMYNSGNADQDFITFGQGMANQEYGNWLKNFQNFINPEFQAAGLTQQAATGQGTVLGQQANLANTGYSNMANLTQADALNRTNLGTTTTSGLANTNNQEAAAKMAASGNALGLGMNLLSLGTSALGGKGLFSAGGLFGAKG